MKKILPFFIVLTAACSGKTSMTQYSISDFGAESAIECTLALQTAIDRASQEGGGRVTVPAGEYLTRTIYLRDGVDLHLEKGAVLKGVEDAGCYDHFIPQSDMTRYDSGGGTANANCVGDTVWMKALIIGAGINGASITGEGTIDGRHVFNPEGEEGMRGPHTIVIAEAKDFRMEGIHITCAANYAFLGYALDSPVFDNLSITEGWDGIHIRGARNGVIKNCRLETGDDCIAGGYWENMVIKNCSINSSCNGIRMIMPSDGVEVCDCEFFGPGKYPHRTSGEARRNNMLFGIVLEPGSWGAAPGELKNIYLHDLKMHDLSSAVSTSVREGCEAFDLRLENINASNLTGSVNPVVSWLDKGFKNITVTNCSFSK